MQKKTLKVAPARKIYQPKYPSFEDKNPLLYPETRPYPFSLKFIKWASTGGLASIMLFSGNEVLGQTQRDSIYNPFPLENAGVPYQPVSFGTGQPRRLKAAVARQAIQKAFAESGIKLDEKVWLKNEDTGVFLDGYSHKDKIGFLLIDYTNMDETFTADSHMSKDRKKREKKRYDLDYYVKWNIKQRGEQFIKFVEDKDKYIKQITRYNKQKANQEYADNLLSLAPQKEFEKLFKNYSLQHDLDAFREVSEDREAFVQEIFQYIDGRFEDSEKKKVLFRFSNHFRKSEYRSDDFDLNLAKEFRKLEQIKSDKKFIKNYFRLIEFLQYNSGSYRLSGDKNYHELKLKIMQSHPLRKWQDNLESLDAYHDRHFVSLNEARSIDEKNKSGTQFIAPISTRDRIMIVPDHYSGSSKELQEETGLLRKEYNKRNGMTDEIFAQQRTEYNELTNKYKWSEMRKLPKQERDSLSSLRDEERAKIKAKYKAMEQLTDEERAEFKVKFDDLEKRRREWRKKNSEEVRMNVLRKLEDEVKMYIKWAKSQMGS